MNNELIIEPFEAKFEDVQIHVHNAKIEIIHQLTEEVLPKQTPFTGLWEDVATYNNTNEKTIVGKVFIIFRNQGNDFELALWFELQLVATAPATNEMAAIFCKLVQYLFDWMKTYNDEHEIKSKDSEKFIVPGFLYAKEQFKSRFPD